MADHKLTETQVADLVTILRGDSSLDSKVQFVTNVKSGIKQHNVPETCVPQLFDGLRAASTSQHAALVNVGFTSLNHLLTRLSRQDPKLLVKEAARTLPLVVEKLGDQKEKLRSTALSALNTLYTVAPVDVERVVRNSAMVGKNPRAKEGAMQWLLQTHKERGLQFRSYVPLLMDLLEDADGMVRDAAKATVIELFKNAPNAAKSDLKRQLKNFKVRPAIEQAIVKALVPTSAARPETPAEAAPPPRSALAASVSSSSAVDRPITPALDTRAESIEAQYVNTHRELSDIFKEMAWCFEGRETEQNWVKREESIVTMRRLNAGNAPSDFLDTFVPGLRGLLDGIIKAINSLRTSLSKEGCTLVQDLANTLGPAMEPLVELLMQTLIKQSANAKKIASQLANVTVDTLIGRVSYNHRLMQHIWSAAQDKNVQPRTYVTGWIKTILNKEAGHKNHVEHTGGVDLIEKCIKKGLADPNPAVREKMRSTFWTFWAIWPARADAIKEDLDPTAQKLLNRDPGNPNSSKKADAPRPGLGLSRSTMTSSKPSLRETMLAQKKATLEAKKLPARPGSAMAHISPVRKVSDSTDNKPGASSAKPTGSRTRPEAGTVSVNASGMSVAPMRPTRRRPELAARPATAGPYSVRDQPSSMLTDSPPAARPKPTTSRTVPKETTPRRVVPRTRPGHVPHASESSINSPGAKPKAAAAAAAAAVSPRISPAKFKSSESAHIPNSPSRLHEDPTLEIPTATSLPEVILPPTKPLEPDVSQPRVESQPPPSVHVPEITFDSQPQSPSQEPVKVYEDPFVEEQKTPIPTFTGPVLEDRPVNEDAAHLQTTNGHTTTEDAAESPEKVRQNSRLLDSGINKIKAKSLEVHGFRKFQSLLRDNKTVFTDEKFETLLLGLFEYLEDSLPSTPPEKVQDVKAQILTTIKLLLKRQRENFQPHVPNCLESLIQTRSAYDNRAHIVSGLELLSDELVSLGDAAELVVVLGRRLQDYTDTTTEGCRSLSMGLHILRSLLDRRDEPTATALADGELAQLAAIAERCIESADSGVRMDAVQLCVALHARIGEQRFWEFLRGVKDDPKSLITYYIVKRQREQGAVPA